jgi:membrane protein
VQLPWLEGLTLYDLLELYGIGIAEGALSNRAGAIRVYFYGFVSFALFYLKFNSHTQIFKQILKIC